MNRDEDAALEDVAIARALRGHTRTLLLMCAACAVLALLGAGALSMAGQYRSDVRIVAGLSLLAGAQLLAITAAAIAGMGWLTIVRGVGEPGSRSSQDAARRELPQREVARTARRLAVLLRLVIALAVVGVTVWAIVDIAAVIGAAVGAVLLLQLAVVLAIVRVNVLLRPRLP
ncbi:MAG TPA: hypothetical protein H9815_09630 [Candidatus Ruania gallistercoris]|uniref:Uncharacterized protein n=1 Tax=Candidatus Ruania gallistercoris TaxID=2838746 RepID=A0A9D2EEN6_9MICO|nr:hypothetical protein [Candidatus Ruania gallistercoris]